MGIDAMISVESKYDVFWNKKSLITTDLDKMNCCFLKLFNSSHFEVILLMGEGTGISYKACI